MASGNSNPNQSLPKQEKNLQNEDSTPNLGCSHYKRNCKLICPSCKKKYICRLCHNEKESHQLNRFSVERIECSVCHTEQPISQFCISKSCKVRFGKKWACMCQGTSGFYRRRPVPGRVTQDGEATGEYFCRICCLFDDEDRKQYHCDGCGLCRVGGRENFYHCDRCRMCLPMNLANTHTCIDEISLRDCPVCLEDIHTSRLVSHIPPCGHLIHSPCFNDLIKSGFYACPTCGRSMVQMDPVWRKLDEEIAKTPMSGEFSLVFCDVLCKDCHEESSTRFHTLGLKCGKCGSYNTCRSRSSFQLPGDLE